MAHTVCTLVEGQREADLFFEWFKDNRLVLRRNHNETRRVLDTPR